MRKLLIIFAISVFAISTAHAGYVCETKETTGITYENGEWHRDDPTDETIIIEDVAGKHVLHVEGKPGLIGRCGLGVMVESYKHMKFKPEQCMFNQNGIGMVWAYDHTKFMLFSSDSFFEESPEEGNTVFRIFGTCEKDK
jgi:hypothetical protein